MNKAHQRKFAAAFLALILGSSDIQAAGSAVFEIVLESGLPVGASNTLRVDQRQNVTLRWTSDMPAMLHLHGYNLTAETGPGQPGEMAFLATVAGRFPVEVHDAAGGHRTVLYIEVHPK